MCRLEYVGRQQHRKCFISLNGKNYCKYDGTPNTIGGGRWTGWGCTTQCRHFQPSKPFTVNMAAIWVKWYETPNNVCAVKLKNWIITYLLLHRFMGERAVVCYALHWREGGDVAGLIAFIVLASYIVHRVHIVGAYDGWSSRICS